MSVRSLPIVQAFILMRKLPRLLDIAALGRVQVHDTPLLLLLRNYAEQHSLTASCLPVLDYENRHALPLQ